MGRCSDHRDELEAGATGQDGVDRQVQQAHLRDAALLEERPSERRRVPSGTGLRCPQGQPPTSTVKHQVHHALRKP